MIPYFRKIRKKMADDNRPLKPAWPAGRYMRYAIGEIVLVVIGILIALQINNWNEERKTRIVTHEYLNNIKNDLLADSVNYHEILDREAYWKKRIADYYKFYDGGNWSTKQISDSCLMTGFAFFNYIPINNTYSDMLSSGKTSLLSELLRNKLAMLIKEQELLMIIDEHLIADTKKNVHELEKYWNLRSSAYFSPAIPGDYFVPATGGLEKRDESEANILRGLQFHHNLYNWMHKHMYYHQQWDTIINNQSSEIIKLIDEELQK
jgi:hypothetical protein